MKPACLPEQLLCSAVGASSVRACWIRTFWFIDQMGAAFQGSRIPAGARQHGSGKRHMLVLAIMRGASERQFLVAKPIGIGCTAFDERQRLHRLAGRTREDGGLDIAERKDKAAIAIDDRHRATMTAFDKQTTGDFDGDGIGHGSHPDAGGMPQA